MPVIEQRLPVNVHLQTEIFQQDEQEQFDIKTRGELVTLGDAVILRYEEALPEQPKSAIMFKFMSDGTVTLSRRGQGMMKLFFQQGQRLQAQYQTLAGPMAIDTLTTLLAADVDGVRGNGVVAIDYTLFAEDQLVGQYRIRLQFNA